MSNAACMHEFCEWMRQGTEAMHAYRFGWLTQYSMAIQQLEPSSFRRPGTPTGSKMQQHTCQLCMQAIKCTNGEMHNTRRVRCQESCLTGQLYCKMCSHFNIKCLRMFRQAYAVGHHNQVQNWACIHITHLGTAPSAELAHAQ